jgi:hypothetical protein
MATAFADEVGASLPHARPLAPLSAMRRCASTPTLRSLDDGGMEVFVVLRNFQEFGYGLFNRLPTPLRDGVRDAGVCHYMTVFRQPDGTLVQFDFGPAAGGDIHFPGPLARLLSKAPRSSNAPARPGHTVGGSVREHLLTTLPDAHMYVGRTHLSMADIRAWNDVHASPTYELHRTDCRHYVNSLVRYTTGVERATVSALRAQWSVNRARYGLAEKVVRLGHYVTDAANWDRVKAVGNATAAVLMALTGQQALAKLKAAPLLGAVQRRLLPVARRALVPVPRAISQRPAVAVGATAVATYAASGGQAPGVVRDTLTLGARVAGGVQSAVWAAASLAEHVGRSASAATQHTTSHAVALATGIAGVASRGAANMMVVARPRRAVAVAAAAPVAAATPRAGPAASGAITVSAEPRGSPLRAMLPAFKGRRAQQLALVASRR